MQSPDTDSPDLTRDPDFYAQDIICAIADMAQRFPRADLIAALAEACAPCGLEVVDLRAYRNAA